MATVRKVVFQNDEIYHVYNRSMDQRVLFPHDSDFIRMKNLIRFYKYKIPLLRYSQFLSKPVIERDNLWKKICSSEKYIEIIAYCLMPNHFHFLLRQMIDKGVTNFISNLCNSYTRFFNVKNNRHGSIFEGVFKAIHIDNEFQLIHTARYIHINPAVSCLVKKEDLEKYKWSSYPEYMGNINDIADKEYLNMLFKSKKNLRNFTLEQIDYAKELKLYKVKFPH